VLATPSIVPSASRHREDRPTELVGGRRIDDAQWVAVNHLEGDFPGGVVALACRFTLAGDRVAGPVIAP